MRLPKEMWFVKGIFGGISEKSLECSLIYLYRYIHTYVYMPIYTQIYVLGIVYVTDKWGQISIRNKIFTARRIYNDLFSFSLLCPSLPMCI